MKKIEKQIIEVNNLLKGNQFFAPDLICLVRKITLLFLKVQGIF